MDTQTNAVYFTLITSLGFLTFLMALFIVSLFKHQRQRLRDYQKQVFREIELIDGERERISADLHDELGTGLSAIGLLLQQVDTGKTNPILEKVSTQVRKQQEKIKEITHDLVPRILESHGLKPALLDLFEEIRAAGNIKVTVDLSFKDAHYQPAKSIHVYRVIREIMTNSIKHSGASEIWINCRQDAKKIRIDIRDNGTGFGYELPGKGSGMQNIQMRVELLGASFDRDPRKDKGTGYLIRIPLAVMLQ